ncbi:UNVERIFIED_CONTAM: protein phosphatase 2C domain-containing protein [Hammondia hammondi]|eukprot:XP_008884550.1 protein phosphatase 2C domain-containing protein [Hammondia hammondi]
MAAMSSAELARGEGRIPSAWTRASLPCDSASVVRSPQSSLSSFLSRRFLLILFYLLCTSYWFCSSAPLTLLFSEAHSDVSGYHRAGGNDAGLGGPAGGQNREEESASEEDSSSEDSGEDDTDNEGAEQDDDKEDEEVESTDGDARDFGADDFTRLTKDLERGRHRGSRFSSSDSRVSDRHRGRKGARLRDEGESQNGSRSKGRTEDESARRASERGRSRSDGYGKGYRERSKTRASVRRSSKLRPVKEQGVTPNKESRPYARGIDEDASGLLRDHLQELASMFIRTGDADKDEDDEDLYSIRDEQEKVVVSYAEGFTVTAAGTMVGRRPTDEDAILVNAILPHMPNVRVKAIFDGHGGDEVSRYLADNALTYLSNLTSLRLREIKAACQAMDDAVKKHVWKHAPDAGSTGVIAFIEKVTKPVEVFVVGREIVPEGKDPRFFVPLVEQLRVDALAEGDTETALSLAALTHRYSGGRRWRRRKHLRKAKKIRLGNGDAVFRVVVANVGDSRAVLLHRDGSFTPLSRDQKPEQDTERLRVEAAGGRVFLGPVPRVDNMLAVARSFGDFYMKNNPRLPADKQKIIAVPDIRMFYATPNDYLLLTCDGVFESPAMTYKTVADVMYNVLAGDSVHGRMKHAVKALLDEAYETGSHDNISALLAAFTPRGRFSSHTVLGHSIYTGTGEIIQQGSERQENARVNPEKVKKSVALY